MQPIHDEGEPATMPHDSSQPRVQSLGQDEGSQDVEHKVKASKSRRRTKIVVSDDEEMKELHGFKRMLRLKAGLLDQEEPTELVEDLGSGKKGEKKISTAEVPVSTASAIPVIMKEEDKGLARDAEIAKQFNKKIDIASKEQERLIYIKPWNYQKGIWDKREEVVAETTLAHDIDWSDPAVLRYHAQQNRSFSKAKEAMKRSGFDFQKPPAKRQKIGEVSELVEEQSAGKEKEVLEEKLKKLLVIVPVEEVYIEALQVKYPIID
ncbi:hypothetical protein Tco_0327468 [Tanacetum coccineum]